MRKLNSREPSRIFLPRRGGIIGISASQTYSEIIKTSVHRKETVTLYYTPISWGGCDQSRKRVEPTKTLKVRLRARYTGLDISEPITFVLVDIWEEEKVCTILINDMLFNKLRKPSNEVQLWEEAYVWHPESRRFVKL